MYDDDFFPKKLRMVFYLFGRDGAESFADQRKSRRGDYGLGCEYVPVVLVWVYLLSAGWPRGGPAHHPAGC